MHCWECLQTLPWTKEYACADGQLKQWSGKSVRLRDTFAGKIISETREVKTISEKWSDFYRQKCRAGVRTKLLFLVTRLSISRGFPRRIFVVIYI